MAWYWIVLIVLAALLGLLFLVYMTNADMKLIEKIYNSLIKYHDSKNVEEKIGGRGCSEFFISLQPLSILIFCCLSKLLTHVFPS